MLKKWGVDRNETRDRGETETHRVRGTDTQKKAETDMVRDRWKQN